MKIGDYIRIKDDGYINKIKKVNQFNVLVDGRDLFGEEICVPNNEIIKHSTNIIDLIEVGDYVNGIRVDFTNSNNKLSYEDKCIGFYDGDGDITLFEKEIKSIVTKEQFEAMKYEIK